METCFPLQVALLTLSRWKEGRGEHLGLRIRHILEYVGLILGRLDARVHERAGLVRRPGSAGGAFLPLAQVNVLCAEFVHID